MQGRRPPLTAVRHLPGRIELGEVSITWDSQHRLPIADVLERAGLHVVITPITFRYGTYVLVIPAGFCFDGATIPWFIRWLPGFAKHDWHFLATLPHDYICVHPEILPRPIGDAIFISVMLALVNHRRQTARGAWQCSLRTVQAWLMFMAVSGYTIFSASRGAAVQR
jgi:hypothetical protein